MSDQLNDAIADLQSKYNFFANLQEECTYLKAVKEAITTLEGSGGGGDFDPTKYYTTIEIDDTFITKVNGTNAIADLAPKSGLYKDTATPVNLEVQCQSFEARIGVLETPVSRQATLSAEQMKQIEDNILAELLKKMAK